MTLAEWRTAGLDAALANHPYNPPQCGPIFQAYTEGYSDGENNYSEGEMK